MMRKIVGGFLILLLTACATKKNPDPLEPVNRVVFNFNEKADKVFIKPVTVIYTKIVPNPVQIGVRNFSQNLYLIAIIVNQLLQFRFEKATTTFGRLIVNSTVGIGGIVNVIRAPKERQEDFASTFRQWGVPHGAYLVLPILGSSTVEGSVGLVGEYFLNPISYVDTISLRNSLFVLQGINSRRQLLEAKTLLDDAALDLYSFVRDAYLQKSRPRSPYERGVFSIEKEEYYIDNQIR